MKKSEPVSIFNVKLGLCNYDIIQDSLIQRYACADSYPVKVISFMEAWNRDE